MENTYETILRNTIYRAALKAYIAETSKGNTQGTGLCWAIKTGINEDLLLKGLLPFPKSIFYQISNYPELIKHKPIDLDRNGLFWFSTSDIKIRIEILTQAIQETDE
jgi:hypothetical protein